MSRRQQRALPQRQQRGVAALIVVMVLFFIVSLVAAYTSRNLIFEQRTSTNQYRSTQSLEAAEAGLEWAKAMLNHGRITPGATGPSSPPSCVTSTSSTDTSFRQRYLNQNTSTGYILARGYTVPPSTTFNKLQPTCVFNGSGWNCDCPSSGPAVLSSPSSTEIRPAFRVRFSNVAAPAPPGLVRVEAIGCTRLDASCLDFSALGSANEGRTLLTQLVALTGTAVSPPLAALTAGGAVNFSGAAVMRNGDVASGGWTIQARGGISGAVQSISLPGTPGSASRVDNDTTLPASADRMFTTVFNMFPETFRQAPGTVRLDASVAGCTASGCSGSAVQNALLFNPGRVIWVEGNLTVDTAVGSTTEPALVVVNGNLDFSANATFTGLVYVRAATWAPTYAGGQVVGAVIAEGAVGDGSGGGAVGTPTVTYSADALQRVRLLRGSFVPVPGGWKDFCSSPTGAIVDSEKC